MTDIVIILLLLKLIRKERDSKISVVSHKVDLIIKSYFNKQGGGLPQVLGFSHGAPLHIHQGCDLASSGPR